MNDLERLIIERHCERVIVQLSRHIDGHRFEKALELFCEDATFIRRGTPLIGKVEIKSAFDQRPKHQITQHILANICVTVESAELAQAVSTVFVFRHRGTRTACDNLPKVPTPDTVGEYLDTLVKSEKGWKILRRKTREKFAS